MAEKRGGKRKYSEQPQFKDFFHSEIFWAQPALHRSEESNSAVSRIFNPQRSITSDSAIYNDAPPNAIRRYSRLQICATPVISPPHPIPSRDGICRLVLPPKAPPRNARDLCRRGLDSVRWRFRHRRNPTSMN